MYAVWILCNVGRHFWASFQLCLYLCLFRLDEGSLMYDNHGKAKDVKVTYSRFFKIGSLLGDNQNQKNDTEIIFLSFWLIFFNSKYRRKSFRIVKKKFSFCEIRFVDIGLQERKILLQVLIGRFNQEENANSQGKSFKIVGY